MPRPVVIRGSNNLSRGKGTRATLFSVDIYLSFHSENQVVTRGVKAIGLIYHLTGRVPVLIKQSHLEENEGNYTDPLICILQLVSNMWISSLGCLLVAYLPVLDRSMHQPVSRYPTPCYFHVAAISFICRTDLKR